MIGGDNEGLYGGAGNGGGLLESGGEDSYV